MLSDEDGARIALQAGQIAKKVSDRSGLGAIILLVSVSEGKIFAGSSLPPEKSVIVLAEALVQLDQRLGTGKTMVVDQEVMKPRGEQN